MRKFHNWIGGLAAMVLFATVPAQAAVIGYLEIPDIPGESENAVDNNETITIGGNRTETIKGGKAVVIGALWNGSESPPRRNSKGTVKLTLQRGALSASLLRLKDQRRAIPELKLVTDGQVGPKTEYKFKRVLVTSYSINGSGLERATEEIVLTYQSVDW